MPGKKSAHPYNEKRRKLLRIIGLGTAAFAAQSVTGQVRPQREQPQRPVERVTDRPKPEITNQPNLPTARYITVRLLRPHDLLFLELRYYNMVINSGKLVKRADPAYVVVVFQSQTISEQAWNETTAGLENPTLPGKLLLSGDSRLVFKIPSSISSIPLDVKDMLDWEKYELMVNDRAKQPAGRRVVIPRNPNQRYRNIEQRVNAMKTSRVPVVNNNRRASVNRTAKAVKGMTKNERLAVNEMVLGVAANSRAEAIVNVAGNIRELVQDPVGPPGELQTSIEVPLRLYLSPTKLAGWNHLTKLDPDKGIVKETNKLFELWHTRMGTKTPQGIDETDLTIEQRIVRALWADDAKKEYNTSFDEKDDNFLGLTSMTNKDRHQIVHESSNFQIPRFVPPPIKVNKLFLSTLGAWLDSEFIVQRKKLEDANVLYGTDRNSLNLLKWRHIETLGREHYVEIVRAGHIMPFGHEAVLIKITERKIHEGSRTAAHFQRKLVIITEPVKEYDYQNSAGTFMNFCFSKVEMVTTVSPLLDEPPRKKLVSPLSFTKPDDLPEKLHVEPPAPGDEQFVIIAGGKEFPFKVKAEDVDGNLIDFTLPLAFVSTDVLGSDAAVNSLISGYNSGFTINHFTDFKGQRLALAPKEENGADTAFTAYNIQFGAMFFRSADEPQGFLPIMVEAKIIEPSYQKLTGNSEPVGVSLFNDANDGKVFAKFNFSKALNFANNTDKTGGLAAPNFNLEGLSKISGAFGGRIDDYKNKITKAADFFDVSAMPLPKLFGVFELKDILVFATGGDSFSLNKPVSERLNSKIPNLVTEETPAAFITSYILKPNVTDFEIPPFCGFLPSGGEFAMVTQVTVFKDNPTAPQFSTKAYLKNFDIGVVKPGSEYLVRIQFKNISFESTGGKKADISVDMKDQCLVFGGPLKFVNRLIELIDPAGFSDPPYVDVSVSGIKCGYTLALPNFQLGAFTLSNLSLGAEVNLPFSGGPMTFGFRFCERQQPFTLTVSCLGGGGFFGLELDMNGIRQIEAALEFGAAVSINLGVASGSVSVMAGIYFKMEMTDGQNSTQLTGYVRINGSVSVLGLITASLELYLALTWLIDKKKVYGEASLKIKVEVLFFSATVTVRAEKTFAGDGADPNLSMCLAQKDWENYCGAFAA